MKGLIFRVFHQPFFIVYLVLILLPISASTQVAKPDCPRMLERGDRLLAQRNPPLEKVLQAYLNALNCGSKLSGTVGPKIQAVFELIEKQKKSELASRRLAQRRQREAEAATQEAERISRSNLNGLTALRLNKTNPAQALRLAEMNYHLYPQSETAVGIFRELFNSWGGGQKE